MFENITGKIVDGKYTAENAFFEIVVLMLVSFILGWMTQFIWDTFFNKKNKKRFI